MGLHVRGSPNIEMDEHTFLVNRERAVDYLNSLDKVFRSFPLLVVKSQKHTKCQLFAKSQVAFLQVYFGYDWIKYTIYFKI